MTASKAPSSPLSPLPKKGWCQVRVRIARRTLMWVSQESGTHGILPCKMHTSGREGETRGKQGCREGGDRGIVMGSSRECLLEPQRPGRVVAGGVRRGRPGQWAAKVPHRPWVIGTRAGDRRKVVTGSLGSLTLMGDGAGASSSRGRAAASGSGEEAQTKSRGCGGCVPVGVWKQGPLEFFPPMQLRGLTSRVTYLSFYPRQNLVRACIEGP